MWVPLWICSQQEKAHVSGEIYQRRELSARAAASEGCILGKINELGEDGGASDFKKNMADFCGVSFKGAFEGWAQELKEKFGLVRGSGSGS